MVNDIDDPVPAARTSQALYDVVIVGGGPGGLAAALTLGRARKRVLLCDSGPRRNAAAVQIHNFVTRDGTTPDEFRRVGREQLATYPNVELLDDRVESIEGARGAFRVRSTSQVVEARRVLLCTGMADELPPLEGFKELWGSAIFQCPYCHGWEAREQRWGYLAQPKDQAHLLTFSLLLRAWSNDVTVFTNGAFELGSDARDRLAAANISLLTEPVKRLVGRERRLEAVELANGQTAACEALFVHPVQRQVELVRRLGLQLDDDGYIRADAMTREASVPGIYVAGDLTTRMQSAIIAAAAGMQAAAMINTELTAELATAAVR